jgi:hypothetical protein
VARGFSRFFSLFYFTFYFISFSIYLPFSFYLRVLFFSLPFGFLIFPVRHSHTSSSTSTTTKPSPFQAIELVVHTFNFPPWTKLQISLEVSSLEGCPQSLSQFLLLTSLSQPNSVLPDLDPKKVRWWLNHSYFSPNKPLSAT